MTAIKDLVDDWTAMKAKLEDQLTSMDDEMVKLHGSLPREKIKQWIAELDELIVKYSFPI
jgi:hypothetical protein